MKKLLNLEWSFSNIDNSWKTKTCIISTESFRMMIKLTKTFLQTQSFFIVWKQKKGFSTRIFYEQNRWKGSCLTSKGLAKLLPRIQKLYQITYIFCNTVSSVSIQPFYANWLVPWGTPVLQCICRTQLIIHTTHLPCCLPCKFVTSLLAYCRE